MDIPNDTHQIVDFGYERCEMDYDQRIESVQENLRDNAVLMFAEWADGLDNDDPALARMNDAIIKALWERDDLRRRMISDLEG